jgi:hypothetical protein
MTHIAGQTIVEQVRAAKAEMKLEAAESKIAELRAERETTKAFYDDEQRQLTAMRLRAEAAEAENATLKKAANALLGAMETCHICKGTLVIEAVPAHCEDCPGDCDEHPEPDCTPIYVLHQELRALATPQAMAPQEEAKEARKSSSTWSSWKLTGH